MWASRRILLASRHPPAQGGRERNRGERAESVPSTSRGERQTCERTFCAVVCGLRSARVSRDGAPATVCVCTWSRVRFKLEKRGQRAGICLFTGGLRNSRDSHLAMFTPSHSLFTGGLRDARDSHLAVFTPSHSLFTGGLRDARDSHLAQGWRSRA